MNETEIKDMLTDIIENNTKYDYVENGLVKYYSLGEEIKSDITYRKVDRFCVFSKGINLNAKYRIDKESNRIEDEIIVFRSYSFAECDEYKKESEEWIEAHRKTWVENKASEYKDRMLMTTDEAFKVGAAEAFREFKERIKNWIYSDGWVEYISADRINQVIEEMGL